MTKINVFNWDYDPVGDMELPDEIFAVPLRRHLLWEYVRIYRANQRQGTASTKTKAEVRGGGRKPWRQKGTGRARIGGIRSPLWRSGGVTHGPRPKDFRMKMNKKQKRQALKMALSQRLRDNDMIVLENLNLKEHKTRFLREKLHSFSFNRGILFVDADSENRNLYLAQRNLRIVDYIQVDALNTFHILSHGKVVFSKPALEKVAEVLKS